MKNDSKGSVARQIMTVVTFIILAVALFFRIWKLDSLPGINGDEAWLGWKAFQVAHGARLDWMTFSGNLTDPFYVLPLIGLHLIFPPSASLLRCVAVVSGILVLPVNFYFCQWVFDRKTAWGTTLLLAVLPVNILYSRFGWEPSQTVLFALPAVYLALALGGDRIRLWWGCGIFSISLVAALLVHPTNFFLAGMGISALAARWFCPEMSLKNLASYIAASVIGFGVLALIAMLKAPAGVHDEIFSRIKSLELLRDADRFVLVWGRFFNGLNSLASIPGSWRQACSILDMHIHPWVSWADQLVLGIFLLAFGSLLMGYFSRASYGELPSQGSQEVRMDIILLIGFLGSSILFDLLNGPSKCAVWFDRYALWFVPIGVLILVRGIVRLIKMIPQAEGFLCVGTVIMCLLLLMQTGSGYFAFMERTGGNSGMDARVGREDLKLAAARVLAEYGNHSSVSAPIFISSDWFVYWPILYFLKGQSEWKKWNSVREDLFVHYADQRSWDIAKTMQSGQVVFAEFQNSFAWKIWDPLIKDSGINYQSLTLNDVAGRQVLVIKRPMPSLRVSP